MKNYEYDPADCYYRLADVVAHLQSDEEMSLQNSGKPLSHCQARLRPIIRDFWDGKVFFTNRRFQKGGKRVRALKHLRRKESNSTVKSESENSASKHVIMVPGWQVVINNDNSLSLLRVEDWLLDQQRVITEIRADQREDSAQYICTISSHGCILDPKDMGLKLGQMSNPKEELELLAKCMSGSKLCKGFLTTDRGVPSCSEFRVAEYSTASDPSTSEVRVFSNKCQIVCSSKATCVDCVKCRKCIRHKKQRLRERLGKLDAKANHRFMNREQLVTKLKELQKELQACRQKIRRLQYSDCAEEPNDDDYDGGNDIGSDVSEDRSDDTDDDDDNDASDDGSSGDNDGYNDSSDDAKRDNIVNSSDIVKQKDNEKNDHGDGDD